MIGMSPPDPGHPARGSSQVWTLAQREELGRAVVRLQDFLTLEPEGWAVEADVRAAQVLLQSEKPTGSVMQDLLDGDPLELRARGCRLVRAQWRVIDPDRLLPCSAARVAFQSRGYIGKTPFEQWLDLCIGEAVRDVLNTDEQEERDLVPMDGESFGHYAIMSELLGLPPEHARVAMLTFNRFPEPTRRVCFEVVVKGASLDALVERGLGSPDALSKRLKEALDRLSRVELGKVPKPAPDEFDLTGANDEEFDEDEDDWDDGLDDEWGLDAYRLEPW